MRKFFDRSGVTCCLPRKRWWIRLEAHRSHPTHGHAGNAGTRIGPPCEGL